MITVFVKVGGTKFANCFICNEQGHLSKNCPENTHGIYPKGGCFKIRSGVTYLARDCLKKSTQTAAKEDMENEERPRGKVTKFVSGENLEDDFVTADTHGSNKDKSSASKVGSSSDSRDGNVKPKKKQGTKVVNFVG